MGRGASERVWVGEMISKVAMELIITAIVMTCWTLVWVRIIDRIESLVEATLVLLLMCYVVPIAVLLWLV